MLKLILKLMLRLILKLMLMLRLTARFARSNYLPHAEGRRINDLS